MSQRAHITDHELPIEGDAPLRYVAIDRRQTGDGAVPLVIGLHYGWEGDLPARHARDFTRVFLEPTFAAERAVLLAPYCPERTWHHPRSVAAVLALREHAIANLGVDPAHVVLAGYSLGGMGTWFLGPRHPDLFAAGIAVAAVPILYPDDPDVSGLERFVELADQGVFGWRPELKTFPMWVVNSRADELIPHPAVAKTVERMRRRGGQVDFTSLDGVGHYDSRQYVDALRPVVAEVLQRTASG
ncbi:MAG: prolyl oligopeptidase family serine peptidase [Acidobacteria bacterium]|nr:prolyl oligopeptidase family serine peptidase [Acidobacteriota bacterium]